MGRNGSFAQPMDNGRHKIVIVDDERGIRTALARLLSASGYAVESFASGEELLRADALGAASCLLIDVQLGAESGLDLASDAAVRRSRVPIVFISASDETGVSAQVTASGGAAYLRKPFRAEELLAALAAALAGGPKRA